MKIKLKELHPNPFKKQINSGKLNPEKIEKLKESIKSDGFWAGIMCRKADGEFQIPFGHHRVEAAKQVFGEEYLIDIPFINLSDEQMVRMLANENSMQNEEFAIYQVDTVVMAREWLRGLPQRSKHQGKGLDVSASDISDFLGAKNWSRQKIDQYLRMHEQLHPTILKELKNAPNTNGKGDVFTVSHAREIVKLDNETQKEVYEEIKKKDITYREMGEVVGEIKRGSTAKEAIQKTIRNRDGREAIQKIVAPFEGQKIVLLCDSLIKSIKNNPLSSYPPKGQEILKKIYSQLITVLKKEMED